ncbi:MAG: 7-cyano-7-deazaguanine synthase [Nitrospirota bacterium]
MGRRAGKIGVLTSGGVESAALITWALGRFSRVTPLYVRAGLRWESVERRWLGRLVTHLASARLDAPVVLDVPVADLYGRHWSLTGRNVPDADSLDPAVYLPGRNLLLLSKAAVYAALHDLDALAVGPLMDNPFPDATPEFFDAMSVAIQQGLSASIPINTPFRALHKTDVIAQYRHLPWGLTYSCIRPVGLRHCGRCNKCAERRKAFAEAGVEDTTRYARA